MNSVDWISLHNKIESDGREIMALLTRRSQTQKNGLAYSKATTEIRNMMRDYNANVTSLRQSLNADSLSMKITEREAERRQFLLNGLENKYRELEKVFDDRQSIDTARSALLGETYGGGWGSPAAAGSTTTSVPMANWEDEETRQFSTDELKQQQQLTLTAQDEALEDLSSILGRTKNMAVGFHEELTLHNEIIDDIHDHVDRTNERLVQQTRQVSQVTKTSGTCCYWVIIVVLFVAILTVFLI